MNSDKSSITQFALLRHAETEWNREKRIQGQQDAPLTSDGRQQAEEWARTLNRYQFDHLVTSDLGRAKLTANIINRSLKLPFSEEPRLREQHWGMWSGMRFGDLSPDDLKEQVKMGWHFRPAGGESRLEVLERSRQALTEIAQSREGGHVLVVTHGGVIRCLLYRLCKRSFLPEEPPLIEPYRLHWLSFNGVEFKVDRLNEEV
jgi:broad specificity phosphatase PhoE